jgi:hypothetical protein
VSALAPSCEDFRSELERAEPMLRAASSSVSRSEVCEAVSDAEWPKAQGFLRQSGRNY